MTMLSIVAMVFLCGAPAGCHTAPAPVEIAASMPRHDVPLHEQRTATVLAVTTVATIPHLRTSTSPLFVEIVTHNRFAIAPAFWYDSETHPLPEASLPPPPRAWFTHFLKPCNGGLGASCT